MQVVPPQLESFYLSEKNDRTEDTQTNLFKLRTILLLKMLKKKKTITFLSYSGMKLI